MKQLFTAIMAIFVLLVGISGCTYQPSYVEFDAKDELPDAKIPANAASILYADWPEYKTTDEMIAASTHVFVGKVISETYEIINLKTGLPDSSDDADRMIYTVYTIEVDKHLKGESKDVLTIRVLGGTPGYNDEMQIKLLQESNLKYTKIPCVSNYKKLDIGTTYLFCTERFSGNNQEVGINMRQFALYPDSGTAEQIIQQCTNIYNIEK